MVKNITYLIGAGASVGCLPVVSNFPDTLRSFSEQLGGTTTQLQVFKKDLIWLSETASKQASIDTLARQLQLSGGKEELRNLKNLLSIFFYYNQAAGNVDKRYDLFFASLLNDNLEMPDNINVISWNYDCQFEISYNNYTRFNDLTKNQWKLNIINKGEKKTQDKKGFKIFKINGTAQFMNNGFRVLLDYFQKNIKMNEFNQNTAAKYFEIKDDHANSSSLSFAWETSTFDTSFHEAIKETEILVIIGYSFPYFNRKFDSRMLTSMSSTLEKIYIQDLPASFPITKRKVKEILGYVRDVEIQDTPSISEFFIPHDFFDESISTSDKIIESW